MNPIYAEARNTVDGMWIMGGMTVAFLAFFPPAPPGRLRTSGRARCRLAASSRRKSEASHCGSVRFLFALRSNICQSAALDGYAGDPPDEAVKLGSPAVDIVDMPRNLE